MDVARTEPIPIKGCTADRDVVEELRGCVNDNEFCGAPAGTLVLDDYSIHDGITTVVFVLRERPWSYTLER
jgi:hypothetical protein